MGSASSGGTGGNASFGSFGEQCAADWYRQAGYRIIARNWRCREGELDLVVGRESEVVFVEVKARSSTRFGSGADAVDWRKQRRVRQVAARWLETADRRYAEVRFDVADVDGRGNLEILEGCF